MKEIKLNQNVEGEKDKPFEDPPEDVAKKTETARELEVYQKEAQSLVDSYRRFFTTFAKDVSLKFKLSNAFYIDLESGEVNLATQWFADRGFNREQILWATLHELSHFRDLVEDPEGMMRNFDYISSRARSTGATIMKKWQEKFGTTDPELLERLKMQRPISKKYPQKTMNAAEQAAYKIHHTLCLLLVIR